MTVPEVCPNGLVCESATDGVTVLAKQCPVG
jgi:hypothetical protein